MGQFTGESRQCPDCAEAGRDTSQDNLKMYDNGTGYCFACNYYYDPDNDQNLPTSGQQATQEKSMSQNQGPTLDQINTWPIRALTERGISEDAARYFGVRTRLHKGKDFAYAYPMTKNGRITGYQIRKLPKQFSRVGDTKGTDLFGQEQAGTGGQMVIVAEGQDDAMAIYDMLRSKGKNYKVVASLGTTQWKHSLEWLENFDKVMIAFDQDEAGQEAARQLADALTPGKARLVKWGGAKDANDLLRANRASDFLNALGKSKAHDIGGIITGERAWEIIKNYTAPEFVPYPPEWAQLLSMAEGLRRAEISVWTAGSSIGKTSFLRRLKQHILATSDWKMADVELEERVEKTIRGLLQYQGGKPLYQMTQEEKRKAHDETYGTGRIITLDHRANRKGADLIGKFRYLHYAFGVDLIFLDHVTLGVREFGDGNEGVDAMMEDFLTFVEHTGVHLALISHLRKPSSGTKSWSQGAVPSEEDMKGSGSLYQISFDVIGVSRNKQHENPYIRDVSQLHVLKCRETGKTGPADLLYYNSDTRQIEPADDLFINESGGLEGGEKDTGPINTFGEGEVPESAFS